MNIIKFMINNLSSQLIEAVDALDEKTLLSMICLNKEVVNQICKIINNEHFTDTRKLSAITCLNVAIRYLLNNGYDVHLLMDIVKKVIFDTKVCNIHKWVLAKSIKLLVQKCCCQLSLKNKIQFQYWIDLCVDGLKSSENRMSAIIIADSIAQAKIYESSFIYFTQKMFEKIIEVSVTNFEQLDLNYLKGLGGMLNSTTEKLQKSNQKYNSISSKQMLLKIMKMPKIYELFNRIYFLNSQDTMVIDTSSVCQKVNLVKQTFAQCNYRLVKNNNLMQEGLLNSPLFLSTATVLPLFISSLKRSVNPDFMKKYHCEHFVMYILKILSCVINKNSIGTNIYTNELLKDIILPFLSTSKYDFKLMQQDPQNYFLQQQDITDVQQYETIKSASAKLLQICVDSCKQTFVYLYQICINSIYGNQTIITRADSFLVLTITSYLSSHSQDFEPVQLKNILNNIDLFKSLNDFQKARFFNLLCFHEELITKKIMKQYFLLVDITNHYNYYNLRCLDFIYQCASQMVGQYYTADIEDEMGIQTIGMSAEFQQFGSDFLEQILNRFLNAISVVTIQKFWTTLDQIIDQNQFIYSESTYLKLVKALYARVQSDMRKPSGEVQVIYHCLQTVQKITKLSQPYPQLRILISQIFILLQNHQNIDFQQEIVGILNILLTVQTNISSYIKYLPSLYNLFIYKNYIYQSLFLTVNIFINKYQTSQYDSVLNGLYKFCIQGMSQFSDKWFEQDIGDALLLLQIFLHKHKSLMDQNQMNTILQIISGFKDKLSIDETKHRLLNTLVLMQKIDNMIVEEIQNRYQQFSEYNLKVLLVALSGYLLNQSQYRVKIFEIIFKILDTMFNRSMKQISMTKQNIKIDKSKEQQYFSQNKSKIIYMWKNGFKPFEHTRGVLAIIQQQNKQTLMSLVSSLSMQTQLKMKQLYPLLWMGGTFRRIVNVKQPKQNPRQNINPYDLKQISSELHKIRNKDEEEQKTMKRLKRDIDY